MAGLLTRLESLRERLATVAQEVFEGWDFELGGACDEIGAAMQDELFLLPRVSSCNAAGPDDIHSWLLVWDDKDICEIDIPWNVYEELTPNGWKPLENVQILPEHVKIWRSKCNLRNM